MRFEEAEQKYRELEASLVSGELKEDDFLIEVGQLRVLDQQGRRWMLSARTGRWMVHDGRQWVFAEPPEEQPEPEPEPSPVVPRDPATTVSGPVAATRVQPTKPSAQRSKAPRMTTVVLAALILVACVIGGGGPKHPRQVVPLFTHCPSHKPQVLEPTQMYPCSRRHRSGSACPVKGLRISEIGVSFFSLAQ